MAFQVWAKLPSSSAYILVALIRHIYDRLTFSYLLVFRNIASKLKYATYHYHVRELVASSDQFEEPGFSDFNSLHLIFERAKANSSSIILIKGLDLLRIG